MSVAQKKNVLFPCTGNAARSQMAEAMLRRYAGDRFEVHSAGLEPQGRPRSDKADSPRHLERLVARARPGTEGRAVVLVDIDHFIEVNDRFGHRAGDRVLENVASLLRSSLRDSDVVARWGGEEFLVLLSGCSLETAKRLAERMRGSIAATEDEEVRTLTASFGIAGARPDESPDELIARADRALYDAKESGRHRVRVAN